MTVETPDHYGGKPIPEDAIEIALAEAEREKEGGENTEVEAQGTPLIGETNIDPSDYIQIPGRNILIAKQETLKGETWEDTHYKLAENGLFMPSPAIFMPYFVNVRDAAKGNLILNDGNNNPISKDEAEDLWEHLSEDESEHLDAFFERGIIAYDHEVQRDSNGNKILVPQKTEKLESILDKNCYVNLDFDRQGFPKSKSAHQKYIQGENIFFWYPRGGVVASFVGFPDMAALSCDGGPSYSDPGHGVFACAEKPGEKQ